MTATASLHQVAPVARAQMRRATLVAAVTWLVAHLVHAVASLDLVVHMPAYVGALVLWVLGSFLALRTLLSVLGPAQEAGEACLIAVLVPLVELLDVTSVPAGQITTYANWSSGGTAVMIAALVLRRHGRLAVAASVARLAVEVGVVVSATGRVPAAVLAILTVPILFWLLGSLAVRSHLRLSRELAAGLRGREAAAATESLIGQRWSHLRDRHRAELAEEVLPLLESVRALPAGEDLRPDQRERARLLARQVRDALLARSLMDRELRDRIGASRERGVQVLLHNALADGPPVRALRDLVGRLLELPDLTSLSVRTFLDPDRATLVLRGHASFLDRGDAAVRSVVGTGPDSWGRCEVLDLDGDVMVELGVPQAEQRSSGPGSTPGSTSSSSQSVAVPPAAP